MAQKPTPEFRAEVVRVALTSGLPRKQVAADFGVGFSTLSRWIQRDRRNLRSQQPSPILNARSPNCEKKTAFSRRSATS
ncbi:transposase [Yoonia maritima]|uniref:transposase n=1 Tax=Yoonia maritima TaxID=1435347 RepID=UPI000D0EFFC2